MNSTLRCRLRTKPRTSPDTRSMPASRESVPCRMYSWSRPTVECFPGTGGRSGAVFSMAIQPQLSPAADKGQATSLLVMVYEELTPLLVVLQCYYGITSVSPGIRPTDWTGVVGLGVEPARNRRVSRRKQGQRVVGPLLRSSSESAESMRNSGCEAEAQQP